MKRFVSVWAWMLIGAVAVSARAALVTETEKPMLKRLTPGAYQATVKAIVCGGCGEFIQKAMQENPHVEKVEVDQTTRQVTFRIKPGSTVQLADIQDKLNAAADSMGMGADYTLEGLQKVSKKK